MQILPVEYIGWIAGAVVETGGDTAESTGSPSIPLKHCLSFFTWVTYLILFYAYFEFKFLI